MDVIELSKKYPLKVTAQSEGVNAVIRIEGVISSWSPDSFRYAIDELISKGIKDATIYLNTMGGNVFAANDIIEEMLRLGGKLHGLGGSVVASAGSYIASYFDTFEMSPNGQFMYHKPSVSLQGNEDDIESRLTLLKNITNLYRERYAVQTKKTVEEVESLWSKGDVWLTAKEAVEQGFATSISPDKAPVTKETAMMIAAMGAPSKPEVNKQPDNNKKMKNKEVIISKLGLAKDATDEQINAALDSVLSKAQKSETLEKVVKDAEEKAINSMLEGAIVAKKITEAQKQHFKVLAQKDFDSTSSLLESMSPGVKVSGELNLGGAQEVVKANWSMQDYIDNDLPALEALMVSNPSKYRELENAHYGS